MSFSLYGIGVSRGIAIGRAHLISHTSLEVAHYEVPAARVEAEIARFDAALATVRAELQGLSKNAPGSAAPEFGAFISLHLMILNDPMLAETPRELIARQHCNAEWALKQQMDSVLEEFERIEDSYLRERGADVTQVVERVLKALLGQPIATPKQMRTHDTILVARDLSPTDVMVFRHQAFAGFITDLGGATSHTAILARSMNIASVVALHHAWELVREDEMLIVDGTQGAVIVNPDKSILAEYRLKQEQWDIERQRLSEIGDRLVLAPERLVQLGAVPFGTSLLNLSAAHDAEFGALDLAGLNPDVTTLRRSVAVFRGHLEKVLRDRYGSELLALYAYPAQVTFCAKPLAGLADLAGRRIRVSSATQSDWVVSLGAIPVQTPLAEIVANVRSGNIDCAITGTMSGNTIGLHEVTSHIQTTPVNWGLAAFVANGAAWSALPKDLQELLRRELPKLEQAIWAEAASETSEGIACNIGAPACASGRKGRMTEVHESASDTNRRRDILVKSVLPGWLKRCGPQCAPVWTQTLGPSSGVGLP